MPPVSAAGAVYTPAPAASSTPQATPSPSPLPTLAPVPTPPGLLGRRHEEKFTLEEICTDSSYTSPRQSLSWYMVEDRETFGKLVTYYVVDIWIRDVTLLRTAFAQDQFKARYIQDIEDISRQTGAIAALSGDFAVYRKRDWSYATERCCAKVWIAAGMWACCIRTVPLPAMKRDRYPWKISFPGIPGRAGASVPLC